MEKYTLTKALLLLGLILSGISLAQSTTENYVQSKTCLNDDCTKKAEIITSFDGRASHNPTIALTKDQHDATKSVYRDWLEEKTGNELVEK